MSAADVVRAFRPGVDGRDGDARGAMLADPSGRWLEPDGPPPGRHHLVGRG